MAETLAIIGTAGALANIIDVLGKTVSAVADLRRQWQDADLTVIALETQLSALSVALGKIKAWADSIGTSGAQCDAQFATSIDRCLICCRVLVDRIDSELVLFAVTSENVLDMISKFRLLVKTQDFENILRMLDQQTGVLTLLLTACNTVMITEQRSILSQPQTLQVFKRQQDDTASLLVHRDVNSILTKSSVFPSINSSKRSLVFGFDGELLVSRIYQRWMRGSVKKRLHDQQSGTIYRGPRLQDRSRRRHMDFVIIGGDSRFRLAQQLKHDVTGSHDWTASDIDRARILMEVCKRAAKFAHDLRGFLITTIRPQDKAGRLWDAADFLASYNPAGAIERRVGLGQEFKEAVTSLQDQAEWKTILTNPNMGLSSSSFTNYFFSQLERIGHPEYCPTWEDYCQYIQKEPYPTILDFGEQPGPSSELVYKAMLADFQDISSTASNFAMKQFVNDGNLKVLVLLVDLDTYDQDTNWRNGVTRAIRALDRLNQLSLLKRFSQIVILFNKYFSFRRKRIRKPFKPLAKHFLPYDAQSLSPAAYLQKLIREHYKALPGFVGPPLDFILTDTDEPTRKIADDEVKVVDYIEAVYTDTTGDSQYLKDILMTYAET